MITVLGATGFIGSSLVNRLMQSNTSYSAPPRNAELAGKDLGNIIYCIGLTADFRQKPFETIEAHVCLLNKILSTCQFESLTYLSSARVYINCKQAEVNENDQISIQINDPSELYTLSKLTGERLCLSSGKKTKIVRLSNVYGLNDASENFLSDIIRKIESDKFVNFQTTARSSKDYIDIDSATNLLIGIAQAETEGIFNLASGINTSNQDIIDILKDHYEFDYEFDPGAREIIFPLVNINRIKQEFLYKPGNIAVNLSKQIKRNNHAEN